jgi:hypothetical protein
MNLSLIGVKYMTRDDLATLISKLSVGGLHVVSEEELESIFGDHPEAAEAFAAGYECVIERDPSTQSATFKRPISDEAIRWTDRERASRRRASVRYNEITPEEERAGHLPTTGDAAKRPLQSGGEREGSGAMGGSETDPDAGNT